MSCLSVCFHLYHFIPLQVLVLRDCSHDIRAKGIASCTEAVGGAEYNSARGVWSTLVVVQPLSPNCLYCRGCRGFGHLELIGF